MIFFLKNNLLQLVVFIFMKNYIKIIFLGIYSFVTGCFAQAPAHVSVQNEAFNKKLEFLLSFSVPVIDVKELSKNQSEYLILDAREEEEFNISHIENAKHIGYDNPNFDVLADTPKDQPIILYCSVGYRSEKLGEKLKKRGFSNVKNLYGSIFEWANEDLPMIDKNGKPTKKIHTYNKKWSKWVQDGKAKKVW